MTDTNQFRRLQKAVLDASVSNTWQSAVLEWGMENLQDDPTESHSCVCGQQNLRKLFTIANSQNGNELFPIGSSCIEFFGRTDLNEEVDILQQLAELRNAVKANKPITLDTAFFSRRLLEHFYAEGVFTPDAYNHLDGEEDVDFLLTMFNKRNKENITPGQHKKISALMNRKVFPFVMDTHRIR